MKLSKICQNKTLTKEEKILKHEIENKINQFYIDKVRGLQIRSKAETIEKGEANIKYYDSLEKFRQSRNVIDSLKQQDGNTTENNRQILNEMGHFYQNLYSSQIKDLECTEYIQQIDVEKCLTNEQSTSLDRVLTLEEFDPVIKEMKENRSPGSDGIPIEFYKVFWQQIKDLYYEMIMDSQVKGTFPASMNTAIITLIHKGDETDNLQNYRPISLTNCDYKILAFVFARRMQNVIAGIVNSDQTGYIKGRFIGCNVRNIIDIFDNLEKTEMGGAIISIDFEKAFDSLEHNFIYIALKK